MWSGCKKPVQTTRYIFPSNKSNTTHVEPFGNDIMLDESWMAVEKDSLPTLEQLREKKRKKFNRRKQKGINQWKLKK